MPGYLLKQQRVAIQGADDLIIRSLLDRQQFADPDGDAERLGISSAAWPMFGLLWPSGSHLAAVLALRAMVPAERVLELGCGLARASLVAHRRGIDVTASDYHPQAAGFLLENLRLNQLPAMKYLHGRWGQSPPQPAPGVPRPGGADDRPGVHGRYDLVIGSDILYERDVHGDLAQFIGEHCEPTAEVCIVDPNRGNRPAFKRRMAGLGFSLDEVRLDVPEAAGVLAYHGRLLTFRRAAIRWH